MTYSVAPPNYDGGLHVAPHNQLGLETPDANTMTRWLVKIAGHGVVTVPSDPSQVAYIGDPESSFLFAMDTAEISDEGHRSVYPGNTQTIVMQIPTVDNLVPDHTVLHSGPCVSKDYTSLRSIGF
ncbi:unnamed protein product [Clonostachys chloroleuca]|uniref:Uncharacterized protein n=1 Tax=Clonostachys chloroleuca TaxID=1926264 RepID=A0AA35LRR6_9HYPO|nr:unnamed protein product [Clonostachys chloroleuca]